MSMTVHERCRAAIEGKPVDRVPRYLPGIACAVSSELLGRPAHTGTGSLIYKENLAWMKGEEAHAEFVEQMFTDLAELFRLLEVDVFRIPWRVDDRPTKQIDDYTFLFGDPDGAYTVSRYDAATGEYGVIEIGQPADAPPYAEQVRRRVEAREAAIQDGAYANLDVSADHLAVCERYGEEFFVVCNGAAVHVGMDEASLFLLADDPELVKRSVFTQAQHAVALGKALARRGLPGVLVAGGDFAGNDGPFYSPATYREVMLPAITWLCGELNPLGVHYMYRTDGNIWSVSDMMFREAGCPSYGEVDRDVGMTVGAVRARYPELVLWGNMSCAKLGTMPASWVREEAQRIIDESGGTRYFHGPSNAVLHGTPPENVLAMYSV